MAGASVTDDGTRCVPLTFADLNGWADDDHAAALSALRRGAAVLADHPPKARALGFDADALAALLRKAADYDSTADARAFFETRCRPVEIVPRGADDGSGHFTGYYEPEVKASLTPDDRYRVPLHRPPDDLTEVEPGSVAGLDPSFRFARKTAGGFAEHPDRGAIMAGALDGRGLEIAYVADPVDAFFIHIQGAARLRLTDGSVMRITYAAKSGHAYTPIGRLLIERGALRRGEVTMAGLRRWLAEHPAERDGVLTGNRSYIFFREAPVASIAYGPIAAAKVPLTAGRSLAVDRLLHSFHMPVWIETRLADGGAFRRLMVAQDTGSAIVGPARGDIFFGSGETAGDLAGPMNARGRFIVLAPRSDAV